MKNQIIFLKNLKYSKKYGTEKIMIRADGIFGIDKIVEKFTVNQILMTKLCHLWKKLALEITEKFMDNQFMIAKSM